MLTRLKMKLSCPEKLCPQMASLFHGALMELMPPEYAQWLHQPELHPYAQYLENIDGEWYWTVNCLTQEMSERLIKNILQNIEKLEIKKKNLEIQITQKEYQEVTEEQLADAFYGETQSRYMQIRFKTPTAFKQNGIYVFYPDIRCIYQSLMRKYDMVSGDQEMYDADTLRYLTENSKIISYHLKSVNFYLEGIKIPSYIGTVTIKLSGTQTMANFSNLLFQFGTYSGVGIKTSLGMGAIEILKKEVRR